VRVILICTMFIDVAMVIDVAMFIDVAMVMTIVIMMSYNCDQEACQRLS